MTDRLLDVQRRLEDLGQAYADRRRREHPEEFHVNTDAPCSIPEAAIRHRAMVQVGRALLTIAFFSVLAIALRLMR